MKSKKLIILFVMALIIFTLIFIYNGADTCSKKDHSVCNIRIGGKKLQLKVAYSRKAQMVGLIGTTDLSDEEGMIFIYDQAQPLSFWMKNTLIPLSIAFVNADGIIVAIYEMQPELGKPDWELKSYASPEPAKYAIEAQAKWFNNNKTKIGDYIDIPDILK